MPGIYQSWGPLLTESARIMSGDSPLIRPISSLVIDRVIDLLPWQHIVILKAVASKLQWGYEATRCRTISRISGLTC